MLPPGDHDDVTRNIGYISMVTRYVVDTVNNALPRLRDTIIGALENTVILHDAYLWSRSKIRKRNHAAEQARIEENGKHAVILSTAERDAKQHTMIEEQEKRLADIKNSKLDPEDQKLLISQAKKLFRDQMDELEALSGKTRPGKRKRKRKNSDQS